MEVWVEIKKANSTMYQLKRKDGTFLYLDSKNKKEKKVIDFLRGKTVT